MTTERRHSARLHQRQADIYTAIAAQVNGVFDAVKAGLAAAMLLDALALTWCGEIAHFIVKLAI